ncbi:SPFH domain-containing protein [Paenibacillus sp. FSL H7-0331]|uniref:SPFH domain-containing protein n=1 Tax=Paenibacillus sp. FSL H7-0331 TaxID=1920421 RepID=UPI00267A2C0A
MTQLTTNYEYLTIPVLLIAVLVILGLAFWSRYKTVSPDKAMIITGSFLGSKNVMNDETDRKLKIIRGGGAFILPVFQQAQFISLLSHKLDIATPEVYTEQGVPVLANGVAIIKVGGSIEDVATATEQFLGKSDEELRGEAQEVLEGHLRAILGSMTVEDIYKNRDIFAQKVQEVSAIDLRKMGLQIVSFTIKDLRDNNGYLDALGKPRIAAVKRDADIAQAQASRDARIQKANAEEQSQKAELARDTNIAESEKDKQLKIASFKKEQDVAKAEADQAYGIQEAKSKQIIVEEQMKVELVRKEREIDLETKEILRREKQYDSEVKKKADADRYAIEQAAEADKSRRMREADARQYQIEAEARANAEQVRISGIAIAEAGLAKGNSEANVERAKGTAQAEVIRLQGFAEAEAKEKLAEAYAKFGEAAILDIIVKMLPELAAKIAEPMSHIDKLTIVDAGGNGGGATKISKYVTELMATAPDMLKSVSGIDLEELVKGLTNRLGGVGAPDKQQIVSTPAEHHKVIPLEQIVVPTEGK